MSPKTLKFLAGAAVLVVVVALLVVRRDVSATAPEAASGPLFPALRAGINDAASLEVTGAEGSFEIAKGADGTWGLADKGGYPVDVSKVREALIGISEFEIVEAKTKRPEKHSALGLQDPDEPEATSTRVVVRDAAGEPLAAAILGDQRTYQGVGDRTMYARRADEAQAYEVRGDVRVDGVATNWLDKQILKVEPRRIARVAIEHPDGERLVAAKAAAADANYTVEDLPEDAELAWEGVANSLANGLNYLNLEDVKPTGEVDFQDLPGARTTFTCWDGLVVHVETAEHDDATYARFTASFDESARVEPVGPPPPPEGEDPGAAEPAEPEMASAEDVRAEVDELNERLSRWAYGLPSWTAQSFAKRLDDLLKKDEPPVEIGNADQLGLPAAGPGGAEIPPELRAQLEQMAAEAQAAEDAAAGAADAATGDGAEPEAAGDDGSGAADGADEDPAGTGDDAEPAPAEADPPGGGR